MTHMDAMVGGMLGLSLGDAAAWPLAQKKSDELQSAANHHFEVTKKPTWLHSAITSWTVINLDSMLYRPRGLSYTDDFALRAHLLVAPQNGKALRGHARLTSGDLVEIWRSGYLLDLKIWRSPDLEIWRSGD